MLVFIAAVAKVIFVERLRSRVWLHSFLFLLAGFALGSSSFGTGHAMVQNAQNNMKAGRKSSGWREIPIKAGARMLYLSETLLNLGVEMRSRAWKRVGLLWDPVEAAPKNVAALQRGFCLRHVE